MAERHASIARRPIVVVAQLLVLVGFGSTSVALAADQVVLKVSDGMFFWNQDAGNPGGPQVTQFVQAFEKRHPDIKIEPVSGTRKLGVGYDNVGAFYLTREATNAMPDIFWVHDWNSGELIGNNLALDLAPFINADPAFQKNDFPAPVWEAWTRGGKIYGVPASYSAYIPMLNLELSRDAGLADPTQETWTMDDLALYLRRIAKDDNGDQKFDQWGGEGRMIGFDSAVLRPFGADLLNPDETKVTVDSPQAERAMDYWRQLVVDEGVISRQGNLFYEGRAGFVVHEPMSLQTELGQAGASKEKGFLTPTIAPPIIGPGGGAYGVGIGSAYMISRSTAHPREAWTFLREFLSSQNMVQLTSMGVPGFDARISSGSVAIQSWEKKWPTLRTDRYVQLLGMVHYEKPIGVDAYRLKKVMGKYWNKIFDPNGLSPHNALAMMAQEMRGVLQ